MVMKSAATPAKPVHLGYMTTKITYMEREPLLTDPDKPGLSVGQMIDERIERMRDHWDDIPAEHRGERPQIHSITIELPQEE